MLVVLHMNLTLARYLESLWARTSLSLSLSLSPMFPFLVHLFVYVHC
jgi:hypothetical protein